MDNYSGHNSSLELEATLLHLNTTIWNFLSNSINLCKPCHSYVILEINDVRTKGWEYKNLQLIIDKEWQKKGMADSCEALRNWKKSQFQLVAGIVRNVNVQHNKNGIFFERKATIWCRMSLEMDGAWSIQQSRGLQ